MKTCASCKRPLPASHSRTYCSDACMTADLNGYWDKPRSKPKHWYQPVPVAAVQLYRKSGMDKVEADLKRLQLALIQDHINFE